MSKSTRGIRSAGVASLAVSLSIGVAAPAFAVADFKFDRIGGADRYETSTLVDDEFRDGGADVILANGQPGNYADALSANTLAGEKNIPILLTKKDETPASVLQQLKDDAVKNIWVVGGTSVVSDAQVASLTAAGYNVTRVAGADRFGTNNEIIKMNGAAAGNTGLVATGFNFPDALAAGPFSFQGHPLALSTKDSIEDSTVQALKDAGVTKVLIFGGTTVVTPAVEAKLKAAGIDTAARFAGEDRSDTSEQAAEYAVKNLGFTDTHVGVASGYVKGYGADALAGGPLEGKEKSPMLVTRDVDNPDDVLDYLKAHAATLKTGHIYGGTAAVSAAAQDAMEKAAQTAPASATSLPELVSAKIVSTVTAGNATPSNPKGTTVSYTFDEAVANAGGLSPAPGKFFVYKTTGAPGNDADAVVSVSGATVTVRYNDVDTAAAAAELTLATVDNGAVFQTDGKTNPEGDAAIGTSGGGATTTLPAGVTDGPDLLSVGNFRQGANDGETAVDFTFDEAARTTTGTTGTGTATDATGFRLHKLNSSVLVGKAPASDNNSAGGTIAGGNGTSTITVIFDDGTPSASDPLISAADIARGTVDADSVEEAADNESPANGKDKNVLQAAAVSNSGNTTNPDLVSVELRPGATSTDVDQALFTFDQAVTVVDFAKFHLYHADGSPSNGTAATPNPSDAKQVLVSFGPGFTATDKAVGGNVDAGAVTGGERDEEGVANSTTGPSQTAGKTDGPDLTGVALADRKDAFGNVIGSKATYSFDEVVTGDPVEALFHLYLADGTDQTPVAASCAVGPASGTADDNTVVCNFAGPATNLDQGLESTLGTVDTGAVTDGGIVNPEGAERTTGGTGIPAA